MSDAIRAYASQLSLGVSVVEYLRIPRFDPHNAWHRQIGELSKRLTVAEQITRDDERTLDELAREIMGETENFR